METTSNRFQLRPELYRLTYLGICGQERGNLRIQYALIQHQCCVTDYQDYLNHQTAQCSCEYRLPSCVDAMECWSGNCTLAAAELEWAIQGFGIPFALVNGDDVDPLPEADESPQWSVRGQLRAWLGQGW